MASPSHKPRRSSPRSHRSCARAGRGQRTRLSRRRSMKKSSPARAARCNWCLPPWRSCCSWRASTWPTSRSCGPPAACTNSRSAPRSAPDDLELIRQLLVESLVLACLGGVAGLALADAGIRMLGTLGRELLPRLNEIGLNTNVLVFAIAATAGTAMASGIAPALHLAGTAPGRSAASTVAFVDRHSGTRTVARHARCRANRARTDAGGGSRGPPGELSAAATGGPRRSHHECRHGRDQFASGSLQHRAASGISRRAGGPF